MARTPSQKNLADKLIGNREHVLLTDIQEILEQKGWSVALNRKIRGTHGTEEGEVDLLAVSWAYPTEVLVVEAKAFLQVDDLNEIKAATKEMQRGQCQVGRIVRLLNAMQLSERSRVFPEVEWNKVDSVFGIVVTPETEPAINFDHARVPAASLRTLRVRLRQEDWLRPCRLWQAMVSRKWQSFLRDAEFRYDSISLANITFEVPFIETSTSTAEN
jgi:hypothetical protein